MRVAHVAAEAKVNLVLRVLGRAPDGYHTLETVFQRITLADDVTVAETNGASTLDVQWVGDGEAPDVGPVERNLAWRAAAAYRDATGFPNGWAITIAKRIPIGGGLGGGSADAGAVLRALNARSPNPVSSDRLIAIGAPLGADVAFLTSDAALALGHGRGDRLTPLPALPSRSISLLVPPFGVATADAYGWLAQSRGRVAAAPRAPLDALALASWPQMERLLENDLEPPVFDALPALAALRAASGPLAMMSGSGSTVFVLGAPPTSIPIGVRVVACRTAERAAPVQITD
ncbi:MAG: 4-(cytidine 5'-diphospho)-2-C-methyl-D-erythritol kinase [Gemmatimonadaceae bacterium]|nr:4-(cytidine 5'-diphospho)-2-C-methyl-D-erythritol kinase [Gemmatimonadaceae bacterium]